MRVTVPTMIPCATLVAWLAAASLQTAMPTSLARPGASLSSLAPQSTVAVMPPAIEQTAAIALGVDVVSSVREGVARSRRGRPVAQEALDRLIRSAAQSGIACDARQADCAARIGAFGSIDFVLVSRLEGAPVRAALSLVDCSDGRALRTVTAALGDDVGGQSAGLQALARAALTGDEINGRLIVRAPAGGAIFIDGVAQGTSPVDVTVPATSHAVAWRPAEGAPTQERTAVVAAAGTTTVSFAASRASLAMASSTTKAAVAPGDDGGLLPRIGVGSVAVGAKIFVGAAVGAVVVAPSDATRARSTARVYNDAVITGRALVGVSALGLAFAAVGAVLCFASDGAGP